LSQDLLDEGADLPIGRWAQGFTGRAQGDPLFDAYVGVLILGAVAWWSYRYRPLADVPADKEERYPTG
jgi:hypothetical protein